MRIVPHFDSTNLRGIVRLLYFHEVKNETNSYGGGWIGRWVLRFTVGESQSPRVFPAAAQDARSREAQWPHDPQCPGLLHRASTSRRRSARASEAGPDYSLRQSLRFG